jgi:hypothetical protein
VQISPTSYASFVGSRISINFKPVNWLFVW